MRKISRCLRPILYSLGCIFFLPLPAYAGSATWSASPATSDWNTAANWTPATVPNGPNDVATFLKSSTITLGPTVATEVDSIIFSAERFFTIQPTTGSLTISGAGIINNSSLTQNFFSTSDSGPIILSNNANAGTRVGFLAGGPPMVGEPGGRIQLTGNANAGANTYTDFGGDTDAGSSGMTDFFDDSTAATSTFNNLGGSADVGVAFGGMTVFHDRSTADSATFINYPAFDYPGEVDFLDTSTSANAIFTNNGIIKFENSSTAANAVMTLGVVNVSFGQTLFYDNSTAANATMTIVFGLVNFYDGASAGTSTIIGSGVVTLYDGTTLDHATLINNAAARFSIYSTAGSGNITINPLGVLGCNNADSCTITINGAASDINGGQVYFSGNAGHSSFTVNGASAPGKEAAGLLEFYDGAKAGSSTIIANGGTSGGLGGMVRFYGHSDGRTARVELLGNSRMRLRLSRTSPLALGSLEGTGLVTLEGGSIIIGGNNLSTEFAGVIEDSLHGAFSGGQVSKTGTGTLTLSGANTYTGGTVIESGTLLVTNLEDSGTGDGAVSVDAGTLGGSGTISGAVTVGTGNGSGAVLAPASGTNASVTFTTQSTLSFQSDGTYNCLLSGKARRAASDQVVASGVTIDSGARFEPIDRIRGRLRTGVSFTVINNAASTPISGAFANLPDGGTITIGQNTFQASYEGGDGNDLTLTVMP